MKLNSNTSPIFAVLFRRTEEGREKLADVSSPPSSRYLDVREKWQLEATLQSFTVESSPHLFLATSNFERAVHVHACLRKGLSFAARGH
jgi:hypothetical protein